MAFDCGSWPIHLSIEKNARTSPDQEEIHTAIFGEKGYVWIQAFLQELDVVRLDLEIEESSVPNRMDT